MAVRFDDIPDDKPAAPRRNSVGSLDFDDLPTEGDPKFAPRPSPTLGQRVGAFAADLTRNPLAAIGELATETVPRYAQAVTTGLGQAIRDTPIADPVQRGAVRLFADPLATATDVVNRSIVDPVSRVLAPGLETAAPATTAQKAQAIRQLVPTTGLEQDLRGARAAMAEESALEEAAIGARPDLQMAVDDPTEAARRVASRILRTSAESAPALAGAVATRNPELGAALLGGTTGSSTYLDLIDQGIDRRTAAQVAALTGGVEAAGEQFGLENILGGRGLGGLIMSGLAEGGQEVPVQLAQTYLSDQATGQMTPISEQLWGAIESFGSGTALGTSANAAVQAPGALSSLLARTPDSPSPVVSPEPTAPPAPTIPGGLGREATGDLDALIAGSMPAPPAVARGAGTPEVAPVAPAPIQAPEAPRGTQPSQAAPEPAPAIVGRSPDGRPVSAAPQGAVPAAAPEGALAPADAEVGPTTYTAADFLPGMGTEIGWTQRGGELVRERQEGDDSLENFGGRATGAVTGRTPWVAKPAPDGGESRLWRDRPDKSLNESQAQAALDKASSGDRLTPIEKRFVEHASALAQSYADTATRESQAYHAELAEYDAAARSAQRQAMRDEIGDVDDATADEALALDDLVHRAYAAGAEPEAILGATFDGTPAEQARALWRMIAELETTDGADTEATQRRDTGRPEPREERRSPRPQPSQPAAGLFGAPSSREVVDAEARRRDAERDGRTGTGRTDMAAGAGELFAGPRPQQEALEDVSVRERLADRRAEREAERTTMRERAPESSVIGPNEEDAEISRSMGSADADRLGLREAVSKVLGKVGDRVEYLRGTDALPDHLRKGIEARTARRGGRGKTAALYDPNSKRVYLFTDVVTSPERAVWNVAHEIAGHHGLREFLGEKLEQSLGIARQNPTVKSVADAIAAERNLDLKTQRGLLLSTEEALAELAAATRTGNYDEIQSRYGVTVPEGARSSVKRAIDNFLKRLKAMLDDLFGSHVFTDEDVRDLLEAAWQSAEGRSGAGGEALEATEPGSLRDLSSRLRYSRAGIEEMQELAGTAKRLIGEVAVSSDLEQSVRDARAALKEARRDVRQETSRERLDALQGAALELDKAEDALRNLRAKEAAANRALDALARREADMPIGERQALAKMLDDLVAQEREASDRRRTLRERIKRVSDTKAQAETRREEAAQTLDVDRGTPGWNYDTGIWEGVAGTAKRARMSLQDKMTGWEDVQNQISSKIGEAIPDAQNVYQAENLMHGRVGEAINRLEDQQIKPLLAAMKSAKVSTEDLERYLYARHAEERNQQIAKINPQMPDGGSGMTTAQARDILANARPELATLANRVDAITRATRRRLLEHGLIDQATFDAMEAAYQHYVPLRGKREGEEVAGSPGGAGRGLDTRRAPTKRALGRGAGNLAENLLAEVFGDAMRSIVTAEKARVGRTVMRLVLANPNPDLWTVEPVQTERALDSEGQVYERVINDWNDPAVIGVRHNGKLYKVRIEQPELAQALNHVGVDQIGMVTRAAGAFNRYLSAMLTKYNPAFTGVNAVRDALFGLTGMAAEKGEGAALRAALKYPFAAASSFKAAHGKLGNSAMDQMAREFAEHGGKTGYVNMPSVEDIQRKIGNGKLGSYSPTGLARAATAIADQIDHVNDAVENALRLAAYATLRQDGVSPEQAATYAKNLTVNFNRKGLQGSAINSWFLFYNASIQGTKRFADVARKPKTWLYLGALATAQVVATMAMLGMEDDDGTPLWDKIPEHVKARNLVIPAGTNGFVTVPMPYGFNMMTWGAGRFTDAFARPKKQQNTVGKIVAETISNFVGAFSPVPLDDGALGVVPTVARIPLAVQVNRNNFGGQIRREDPYAKSDMPRASMGRPDTIELFKVGASGLNLIGGGNDYTPAPLSAFDRAPEDLQFIAEQLTGGAGRFVLDAARTAGTAMDPGADVEPRKVPIAGKFFANISEVDAQRGMYFDRREMIESSLRRVRTVARQDGVTAAQRLMASMPELSGARLKRNKGGGITGGAKGEIQFEGAPGSMFAAYKAAAKATKSRSEEVEDAYNEAPATGLQSAKTRARDAKIRMADEGAMKAQRAFNAAWNKATDL